MLSEGKFTKNTLTKFCQGFKFSQQQADALVWLLSGKPYNDFAKKKTILEILDDVVRVELDEANHNLITAVESQTGLANDDNEDGIHALKHVEEEKNIFFNKINVEIAGTKGFFDRKFANKTFDEHSAMLQKRLYNMSLKKGHRMVVSKFPTSATHPHGINKHLTEDGKKRVSQFRRNIGPKGCGERHIHSKPTIKRYLNEHSNCSFLEIDKRREHIENLIATLKANYYPNFQVALSDYEPEVELAMRSIDVVVIRTTAREIMLSDNPFACGPSYLFIHDKITVLSCYLDFEREWSIIPEEFRQKQTVIQWLEETLEFSRTQRRRKTDRDLK